MKRLFIILLYVYFGIINAFSQNFIFTGHLKDFCDEENLSRFKTSPVRTFSGSENSFIDSLIFSTEIHSETDYLRNKCFYEHFIVIGDGKTKIIIDPIFDIRFNRSSYDDERPYGYFNTVGFAVQGRLSSKIYFNTYFDRNQGHMPYSVNEFYNYFGVIPGYSRLKMLNNKKYLFNFYNSYSSLSFNLNRFVNLNLGYDNLFVGDGYRSMFLSDFSAPVPYLKTLVRVSEKIEINNIFIKALNPNFNNVMREERPLDINAKYRSKSILCNLITYKPNKNWQISLMEALTVVDSVETYKIIGYQLSPFVRNLYINTDKNLTSALLGLNLSYQKMSLGMIYSQFILNNVGLKTKGFTAAYQLGYEKKIIYRTQKLSFRVEYNHADNTMYMHENNHLHFGHYNQALAHPNGHGFDEILLMVNYSWRPYEIASKANFISYNYGMKDESLHNIFDLNYTKSPYYGKNTENLRSYLNADLQLMYNLNPKIRLQVFVGVRSRIYYTERYNCLGMTSFLQVGLRTAIREKYSDF